MNKFKKILLAFAPIGAIAIATPIVLTSCSEVVNVDSEKTPDITNGDNFKPKSEKFSAFKKEYSSATDKNATIEKHAKLLIKDNDGLNDVIDMWSYNIWKAVKKSTNADESIKTNYKSNIDITAKPTIDTTNNKITTTFLFASTTKNSEGKTIKAIKKYENNQDGSSIETDQWSFKLKSTVEEYSIDGVDKKSDLTTSESFYNLKNTESDKAFIDGLKSPELTLNVKEILTKYEANKTMTWNEAELNKIGTYDSNSNKLTIKSVTTAGKDNLGITDTMSSFDIRSKLLEAKSKFHNAIVNKPSEDVFNNKLDSFYFVTTGEKSANKIIGQIQIVSKNKLFNDLKLNIEITDLK